MAELLFTTDDFAPHGLVCPGVPILIDQEMRLIEPACAWLLHIALVRGRTRSPRTWRTYGEVLYDWWQTLETNGWAWDAVGQGELAAYRNRMLQQSSDYTSKSFKRSTINLRIGTIARFYKWCVSMGLTDRSPFPADEIVVSPNQPPGFLAHVDASGGRKQVNTMTVRHKPMPPQPLSPAELRLIMAKMRPRDRLIVEWAYLTGIRRMEVAGLRRSALPQVQINPLPGMTIDVTKGDNPRMIHPTLSLIDRTRAYMREERAVAVRHAQKRSAAYTEPDSIFLTDDGLAMSPTRIGAIFYAAAKKAGVDASFHALRHTFATAMLRILQRRAALNPEAEINPLLVLQKLLGHANVATTPIYLRVLQTDMTLVEAAVDDLYEAFR